MKRLQLLAALLLCSLLTFAQFSGPGSGTENDPYLIFNPIQLNQLRNFLNQSGVYFKLMADIDLTEFLEDENPSQGWQPVGDSSAQFKGIVDGNGKTVSGLWINRGSEIDVGFFGQTSGANIMNLTIIANTILGSSQVGGISAISRNTTFSNVSYVGTNKAYYDRVGGISASVYGSTFSNVSYVGTISGRSELGGIVGSASNNTTFLNCIAKVNIDADGDNIGGILGLEYSNDNFSISNCHVSDSKINGREHVGGACGRLHGDHIYSNIITSCYVTADVNGTNNVGGICGSSESMNHTVNLKNCGFIGNVSGMMYVGGLVGLVNRREQSVSGETNRSSLKDSHINSFAIGSVTATSDYAGGLIGMDQGYLTIGKGSGENNLSDCYFSGVVSGQNYIGGLVGSKKWGTISNSYSMAAVAGTKIVGGLVGYNYKLILKSSVAINTRVTAIEGEVGRLLGSGKPSLIDAKAYNRTIVISQGVACDMTDNGINGTGVSKNTLKLKATYVAMGWDFTDTWEMQETASYPYFKTQTAPPVITSQLVSKETTISGKCVDGGIVTLEIDGKKQQTVCSGNQFSFDVNPLQAGHDVRISVKAEGKQQSYFTTETVQFLGSGKENDPYQIYTASDLAGVNRKGYFKLMNDIDLTDYINQFSPTEGWQSIGIDGSEAINFDGDGHKITGLWCNSTRNNTGLFSCFSDGEIKNLTVETAAGKQVKGGANTGILIGKMINGTIENCRVAGTVADGTPVGGLVGLFEGGQILRSQANVTISTVGEMSYVGGLVGEITDGMIDQCVSLGTLNATGSESYVGGLVGKNSATVINCYSNAKVASSYNAAGMVAYNYGIVDKCYATGDLYSNNYAAGVIGYNDGANAIVRNCVAMNNKIDVMPSAQGGYGQRIIGGFKNDAPAPELNNYALKTMQVSLNDVPQKVYDDIMNGVAKSDADLKSAQTYQELGWDFDNVWGIHSAVNDGYPYLRTPAIITIVPAAAENLVYSGEAQTLITAGVVEGGELQYSLDGEAYTTTLPTGVNAGEYTVYYKVIADAEHTDMPDQTLTATIAKAPLTIKAETYTRKQYDPMPEFTVSYDGFKNGETNTVLTKQPVLNCTANVDSEPGEYAITISGAEAKNYTIQYVAGKLTVTEPDSYKLTYMVDGKEYQSSMVKYKGAITPLTDPTKEGYTFSGWSEIPETMPAHDVVVTGAFTINSYSLIYKIDGEVYKTTSVVYGTELTAENEPTKEGYTFSGWSEIPATMPAHDVEVTASFTVNSYTVTFKYGDEVVTTENVEYGAEIPLPESLGSDRYTLVEWLEVPATMPARDITIYADYTDGVKAVQCNTMDAGYYQLNGVKRETLQRGINIVRMSDGTTRKVLKN